MEATTPPSGFAVALRRLRESRSLTQEDLAARSGLTAKAIGALERGERRRPYPHTVRSLADGLALDTDERAALVAAVPSRDVVPGTPAASTSQPPSQTATTPDAGHTASAPPAPTLSSADSPSAVGAPALVTVGGDEAGERPTQLTRDGAARIAERADRARHHLLSRRRPIHHRRLAQLGWRHTERHLCEVPHYTAYTRGHTSTTPWLTAHGD